MSDGTRSGLRGGHHLVSDTVARRSSPSSATAAFDDDLNGSAVSGYDGFVAGFDPTPDHPGLSRPTSAATTTATPDGTLIQGQHHWEDITSIRALSDTSFAIGGDRWAAPWATSAVTPIGDPIYITANAADGTRAGTAGATASDPTTDIYMYIATFSPLNTLDLRHLRRSDRGPRPQRPDRAGRRQAGVRRHRRLRRVGPGLATGDEDCTNNGFPALVVNDLDVQGSTGRRHQQHRRHPWHHQPGRGRVQLLNRIGGDGNDGFHGMLELSGFLYVGGRTNSTDVDLESPGRCRLHSVRSTPTRVAPTGCSAEFPWTVAPGAAPTTAAPATRSSTASPRSSKVSSSSDHASDDDSLPTTNIGDRYVHRPDPQRWRHSAPGHLLRHLQRRSRRFPVRHLHRRRAQRLPG